ncbi:MAG: HEAT repeat domain-containing protein [Planctomycetota bacterium]
MATSRRGPRASGRSPGQNSGRRPAPSARSGSSGPAASRRGASLSGRRPAGGSRVGPAANPPAPAAADAASSGLKRTQGAVPSSRRPQGSTPTAPAAPAASAPRAASAAPAPTAPTAPSARSGSPLPKARTTGTGTVGVPRAGNAPGGRTGQTGAPVASTAGRTTGSTGAPQARNVPAGPGTPGGLRSGAPVNTPRLSEQLRALPKDESELPDIPILPPRDDSKIPRNWSNQAPEKGRGTTRHVKAGTAVLTLESEDAVVIETEDETLVQASDNNIKAHEQPAGSTATAASAAPAPEPAAQAPAAPEPIPEEAPEPLPDAPPEPIALPVAAKKSKSSRIGKAADSKPAPASKSPVAATSSAATSRVSKTVPADKAEKVDKAEKSEKAAKQGKQDKGDKSSQLEKQGKPAPPDKSNKPAKPDATPDQAALPVADKKGKGSRLLRAAPPPPEPASAAGKPTDGHADVAPEDLDEASLEEAPREPLDDADDLEAAGEDEDGAEAAAAGSRTSARGSKKLSARGSARASAGRASSRASARGSARGSRRMSKPVDPIQRRKNMILVGGGGVLLVVLMIAFWYITGPFRTGRLIVAIKGPDAAAAKDAIPALADHLEFDAVPVYADLAGQITDEKRLEMLHVGLDKVWTWNPKGAAELAQSWLTANHLGLRKAAALAVAKHPVGEADPTLIAIVAKTGEDKELRIDAAKALGAAKAGGAAEALGDCWLNPDGDADVRNAADDALTQIGDAAKSDGLLKVLQKYSTSAERKKVFDRFFVNDLQRNDDDAMTCWKLALADPDPALRLLAVKTMPLRFDAGKLSPALEPCLKDKDPSIGVEVAKFLGTVQGEGKDAALKTVLAGIKDNDLDATVRKQLTISLGHLAGYKDPQALQLLIGALKDETDTAAQTNLRGALASICNRGKSRADWNTQQWLDWYQKYMAFKEHQTDVTKQILDLWKVYNQASDHMASSDMAKKAEALSAQLDALEDECDVEDQAELDDQIRALGIDCKSMDQQGVVDMYHQTHH